MKFVRKKRMDEATASGPAAPRPPKMRKRRPTGGPESKKASGAQKFVLLIGDEGAILVYLQGATVVRRLFAASPQPDHTGAILDLLNNNPQVPLTVLMDVIDQQYVRHSFPPVSALSVNNLVKRRIDRDFQAEDITGFIRLGREKSGRKEWQYLLIALAYTPLIQQWLDLLVEQPNELKGIHLSPVEGQSFIPALHQAFFDAKPLPWQLLVSHHKVSGFRQIVLRGGKLVFTRVTQAIDDALPAVIAGNIEQEIMNTLEYLRRLGFQETNSLELMVIASQDVQEAIDVRRFNAGQSQVITPLEVAEALGLEQAALSADRFGDVVMAASFARSKKKQLKLMTAYGQKLAQIYAARIGLKVVGVLAALALLGLSVMNVVGALTAGEAAKQSELQRKPVQEQIANVRSALDGLSKDVAFKSAVMLTHDAYLKGVLAPEDFVTALAPQLTEQTHIRTFTWGLPGETLEATPSTAVPMGTIAPAPPATGPNGAPVFEMRIEMDILGEFSDIEELAAFVEAFLGRLRAAMPAYDVTHLPFPWEGQTPANLEISFDQQLKSPALKEGDNKITLIFTGPKDVTTTTNPNGETMVQGGAPSPAPGMTP